MRRRPRRTSRPGQCETGVGTLQVVVAGGVVMVVFVVAVHLVALSRMQHRAASAADLAALAASSAAVAGAEACDAGEEVARANDVELTTCSQAHAAVTLEVATRARMWGRWWTVRARARAAPRDYVPAP